MLTSVNMYNDLGAHLLKLPVAEIDRSVPFLVKDITGLGPVAASVSTSTYAGLDGAILQASKTGMRNIVMKIGYRPSYKTNQTVETLRRELYSYFAPKSEVRMRFNSDDYATVRIEGIVESHEPVIFSKDPEVVISITCPSPFFESIKPVEINNYNNLAVYPSSIGTGSSGFLFEMFVNRTISSVSLINSPNNDILYTGSMVDGDSLQISTVRGNKYARLTRNGDTASVLEGISGGLSMSFGPLSKEFYANVAGASDIPFRLTFTPTYVGI